MPKKSAKGGKPSGNMTSKGKMPMGMHKMAGGMMMKHSDMSTTEKSNKSSKKKGK